jgi:DNA repair exonuclease SbcCD ATPase subunit
MEALGGVVHRTLKSTFEHDQWSQAAADARTELDQLKAEEKDARADRKAKLQAQIARLSKRVDAMLDRAREHSRRAAEDFQARATALQKRVAKERGDRKAALEARLAKLRSDYQSRHPA